MKPDPIKKFKVWWAKAQEETSLNLPNAVCLSTINQDGFPSGRFVDLKGVDDHCFVFCTSLESKKAQEIFKNPKVALTVWWDHVGLQVRITGSAVTVSGKVAAKYWQNRSRQAQVTSVCSAQSEKIEGLKELKFKIDHFENSLTSESEIPKPANWGCFKIQPLQIEFLTFDEDRLHLRELYEIKNGEWEKSLLQP